MLLTILGNPDRYLEPQTPGSSYLVEEGDVRILLDCGGGTLPSIPEPESLSAVVLSHFHWDHSLDLVPLSLALPKGCPWILPPGGLKNLEHCAGAFAFDSPFRPTGPTLLALEERTWSIGPVQLRFAPTRHSAPSFATRIESAGASLVYASDASPSPELGELCRGADLLLMHTLLPDAQEGSEHTRIHSTARSAHALFLESGARRLLLSHRFHEIPDAAFREAAPRAELARRGQRIRVLGP